MLSSRFATPKNLGKVPENIDFGRNEPAQILLFLMPAILRGDIQRNWKWQSNLPQR
jgi:hypothetical protein